MFTIKIQDGHTDDVNNQLVAISFSLKLSTITILDTTGSKQ